jgi:filamentous hemagglutinin family protein
MKRHASMNRIYRLVWNATLGVMVAVAENAKGRGKSVSGRKLIAAALALTGGALMLPQAMAGPAGGQVSSGSGAIVQSGLNTTITQNTQNLAINWQNFSIAANESVRFNQPNTSSIALNRVTTQNPSVILGSLSANGNVFVINPNGVLFGAGAQVDVGGLVATTLNLSDADLQAGKFTFSSAAGQSRGSVVNQGTLNAANGGYVALLAPEVRNEGVIVADKGVALLAAGDKVTLSMNNGSLVSYSIDQGAINALAENKQLIQADGGHIVMSAKAVDALTTAVVNNTGVIRARTVQNVNGTIRLMGDMKTGTVNVGGTLDASAPTSGNGGFIETSAAHVKVANDVKINTAAAMGLKGTWLIDPLDFVIAASGGDMTGANLTTQLLTNNIVISTTALFPIIDPVTLLQAVDPITLLPLFYDPTGGATAVTIDPFTGVVSALANASNLAVYNLPNNNVTGGTGGNIYVNDVVSWAANRLTLNAENNIYINVNRDVAGAIIPTLNGSGTASLALEYGQANVNAGNTSNYYLNGGAQVNLPAGQNFTTKLGSDGATVAYTVITALGLDQNSVTTTDLQGINGNTAANYVLGNNIDATATSAWNGGAGFTPIGGSTTQLATSAVGFTGKFDGLGHTVSNLTINTAVAAAGTASVYVGLFGQIALGSLVQNVNLAGANITGAGAVGGLAGTNYGTIYNSSSTSGAVTGSVYGAPTLAIKMASTGGLVGENFGVINDSYTAAGSVAANSEGESVGGLVGINAAGATIGGTLGIGSYSSASVSSIGSISGSLGGLVGVNDGVISNSYVFSTQTATGITDTANTSRVGGLVGYNTGTLANSFYNIDGLSINGRTGILSAGGLYGSQYQAWAMTTTNLLATDPLYHVAYQPLNIANYTSLPTTDNGLTYNISDAQGLKDMLAFSETTVNVGGTLTAAYSFKLMANVDLAASAGQFVPYFAEKFDAAIDPVTLTRYTISNLSLTDATAAGVAMVGMFGQLTQTGSVSNLGVTNVNIALSSTGGVPALSGLTAPKAIGGLVGFNQGTVGSSYTTGTVSAAGENNVGGLVGNNSSTGQISTSHSTVSVTGNTNVGGLVGINNAPVILTANIDNSYTETGTVNGVSNVGGLIGANYGNVVTSYSSENVNGTGVGNNIGGLIGWNAAGGALTDTYASGNVGGTGSGFGGLVGGNYGGTVNNSYATGAVVAGTTSGGLVGHSLNALFGGSVINSYWDTTTTGQSTSFDLVTGTQTTAGGLTNAAMHTQASFTGFDFGTTATPIWVMYEGYTAPLLRSFLKPLTVTASNVTKVFDGATGINPTNVGLIYTDGNGMNITPNYAALLGAVTYTGAGSAVGIYSIGAPVGTYSALVTPLNSLLITPANTGLYSTQQGYLLSYVTTAPSLLTVVPAAATTTLIDMGSVLAGFYAGLQYEEKLDQRKLSCENNLRLTTVTDGLITSPCGTNKHTLIVKDGGITLPDHGAHLTMPQL